MKKVFIAASVFAFVGVVASCNSDKKSDDKKEGSSDVCNCVTKLADAKDMADIERVQKECEKIIETTKKEDAEKCPDFKRVEANMNRIMEEVYGSMEMDMGDMEEVDGEDSTDATE